MPSAAPWAATELARLPVEAQASVVKPSSRARAEATETTRSLKECVGLAASFLTHTSRTPRRCGQAIGADERRAAGGQAGAGARLRALERQEVVIAPDVLRPALDAPARVLDVLDVVLVGDLERPEAAIADVAGLEAVVRAALLTASAWWLP